MVGEMTIELATGRSVLATAIRVADVFLTLRNPTLEDAHDLMQDYQIAKWVVNQGAFRLVNQAMDVVGGSSFMSSHALSRPYRDIHAGPFMRPGSWPEARKYIGRVALHCYPDS